MLIPIEFLSVSPVISLQQIPQRCILKRMSIKITLKQVLILQQHLLGAVESVFKEGR